MTLSKSGRRDERLIERMYEVQAGRCWLCGRHMLFGTRQTRTRGPWHLSWDHVVPQSHGGKDGYGNRRLAHRICNTLRDDNAQITHIPFTVARAFLRTDRSAAGRRERKRLKDRLSASALMGSATPA